MKWEVQLRIMLGALRKSGWRAGLAIACVAMGIASIMLTLALSTGAQRELEAVADRVGQHLFVINTGVMQAKAGTGQGWFGSTRLKPADANAIGELPGVRSVAPVREGSLRIKSGRRELGSTVRGTVESYPEMRNFQMAQGRMFDGEDRQRRARVAVLGAQVAQKLGEGRGLVGDKIWIGGTPFEVIGQLKEKGVSSDGTNEDDQVLVPLETAMQRLFHVDYLSGVLVQARTQEQVVPVQTASRALLRGSHGLEPGTKDDFEILSLVKTDVTRKMTNQFLQGISRLFAAITLAIGAAGVLAVTFMNVKDRTGEIGLRMAVGARRRDIAALFIAEACLLSVAGGSGGLLLGAAGVGILRAATEWKMAISAADVVLPFAVSVLLGLVFGVLPALKASRMAPVVALRAA